MPIYEYECAKCGHQKELWQTVTDTAAPKCEMCKRKMRRLISQSSFHLKGTGWYVTDYASKRTSESKKISGSEKESKSKEATDSNAKPKKDTSSSISKNE